VLLGRSQALSAGRARTRRLLPRPCCLSPRAVAVQARPTARRRTKFHFQMQAARDYDDGDDGGYSVCYCESHEAAPRAMTRFVTGS